jgi:hypothetical protein
MMHRFKFQVSGFKLGNKDHCIHSGFNLKLET